MARRDKTARAAARSRKPDAAPVIEAPAVPEPASAERGLPGWLPVLVAMAAAYGLCVGVRFMEVSSWLVPAYLVDGQPLMSTHDCYGWLAAAKGLNFLQAQWNAPLLEFFRGITGAPLAWLGFWLPPFLAALAALPVCLLAARYGTAWFGVAAGFLSGAALGFLMRTRVGCYDTDVLSLFFPVLLGCLLAVWLEGFVREGWFTQAEERDTDLPRLYGGATAAALVALVSQGYYSSSNPIIYALFGTAAGIALLVPRNGRRLEALSGPLLAVGIYLAGFPAVLAGLALTVAARLRPDLVRRLRLPVVIPVAVVLIVAILQPPYLMNVAGQARYWLRVAPQENASATGVTALNLPTVLQSIREAQTIPLDDIVLRVSGHWGIFLMGLAGFFWLCWRRPGVAVLLPLLALAFASMKLGNRFAMFGGPVIGIGFIGLADILLRSTRSRSVHVAAAVLAAVMVVTPVYLVMRAARPAPVLPQVYAGSLQELRDLTPKNAWLWQWWDYGYAAQFYAERFAFGDGARHDGEWIYPLAKVHTTDSPLQAAQLMRATAAEMVAQLSPEMRQLARDGNSNAAAVAIGNTDPVAGLENRGPAEAENYVDRLAHSRQEFPADLPPQYLVLSWENMRLGSWITTFGGWDLEKGQQKRGNFSYLTGQIRLDLKQGHVVQPDGSAIPLAGLDMITAQGIQPYSWPRATGIHALVNQLSREVLVLDQTAYDSMLVQMLLGDPSRFAGEFELVLDNYPWVRVWKVRE